MKTTVIVLLLGLFSAQATPEIAEGELPPIPAVAASLRNDSARPVEWASLKHFLEKDDSNQHVYKEGSYDCKHFSLELFRRAQTNGIACFIVLIQFAEVPVGHSVVCFPTRDKGVIYVDFTPLIVPGKQVPMKCIAMLAPGRCRIQVPLEQVPEAFTNDVAFFVHYKEGQPQLHAAAALLAGSQQELSQMQEKIETLKQEPKLSNWQQKQLGQMSAEYEEKYQRHQDALAIYRAYEKVEGSPFDTSQVFTVINLTRF